MAESTRSSGGANAPALARIAGGSAAPVPLPRWMGWLAIATTVGMFIVIVMGATVTSTGSAEGCGRSWPLCHGELIPELAVATLIEFSHRAVTGVEGILVAALTVVTWLRLRQHREVLVLAPMMIFFLLLQAAMGAWAVLYPQMPIVLALHFGISLISFASVLLTTVLIYELSSGETLRDRIAPVAYRRAVWGTLLFSLVVVYLGAYMRHSNAQLACIDWPLCNGAVFPGFSGPVGIVFAHRLFALVLVGLLVWLVVWSRRMAATRPDLVVGSQAALGLVVLQSLAGAMVVFTRLNLFTALSHAGIMALLFGALSYLCFRVLPRPRRAESPEVATRGVRAAAASHA